jgi:multicomponent Na+:H+ antiporter subunit G
MIWIAAALLTVGSFFCAVAALGILRFPDIYTRLHAASKAGPLGAGLILLAVGFASEDWMIAARCVLGLVFLIATTPLSAHLLARAALRSGTAPDSRTSIDKYDPSQLVHDP